MRPDFHGSAITPAHFRRAGREDMIREKIFSAIDDKLPVLTVAAQAAAERGESVWLVGGMVRDGLLGRKSADADIAVRGDAVSLAREVARRVGGAFVPLHDDPPTGRVVKDRVEYDFTSLRAPDIRQDLLERDLTINSIALPLLPDGLGEPIDPAGGLADLKTGLIRCVAKKNFTDDPLRTLRVYRFHAELSFKLDRPTRSWAGEAAPGLRGVAGERILVEMTHLLSTRHAAETLKMAYYDGILPPLLPHLEPPPKLTGSVRGLMLMTVHPFDIVEVLDRMSIKPYLNDRAKRAIAADPVASDPVAMKLAALFQEIPNPEGAPASEEKTADHLDRLTELCSRWKASGALKTACRGILEKQNLYSQYMKACQTKAEKLRTYARYTRDAGDFRLASPVLLLAAMRAMSLGELYLNMLSKNICELVVIWEDYIRPVDQSPPLIDGHEIMETFGLPPGPAVGRLLEAVREERIAQKVKTKRGALAVCRRLLPKITARVRDS